MIKKLRRFTRWADAIMRADQTRKEAHFAAVEIDKMLDEGDEYRIEQREKSAEQKKMLWEGILAMLPKAFEALSGTPAVKLSGNGGASFETDDLFRAELQEHATRIDVLQERISKLEELSVARSTSHSH